MSRKHIREMTVLTDCTSEENKQYIGFSNPGCLNRTDEPIWQIMLVTCDGTGNQTVTYAEGNIQFCFIWDDRLTYTYK